jgi:glucose/arabinose dehydrogenase
MTRWPAIIALSVLVGCGAQSDESIANNTVATTTSSAAPATSSTAVSPTVSDTTTTTPDPSPAGGKPEVALTTLAEVGPLTDAMVDPSGTNVLVVEQSGRILEIGSSDVSVIADLTGRTAADGERGLLGATFTADGEWLIVHRTSTSPGEEGDTVIEALEVRPSGEIIADAPTRLLTIDQPFANHNGGDLVALPDSSLLVSTGDGGSGGDPNRVAHRLDSLLGKILRIAPPGNALVPADNPWFDSDEALDEIWSSGLRNPWRIDVDPLTGDLWVADVGQNRFEEISVAPANGAIAGGAGADFGWSSREGDATYNDDVAPDTRTTLVEPIHVYQHGPDGCSISGGMMYRGLAVPGLWGWFLFADLCAGQLRALNPVTGEVVVLGAVSQPTAVVRGIGGEPIVVTATGDVISVGPP